MHHFGYSCHGLRYYANGQKSIPEAQVAIQAAYDSDINFIDSADIYGGGKSEEVFGQALKQMNLKREDLFIQSKTGIVPGKRYDFQKSIF